MAPAVQYKDECEIEEAVKTFENCEYGLAELPHALHLTVAAGYLSRLPPEEAMAAMRRSLLRFTQHHRKQGYHETISRFWMELGGLPAPAQYGQDAGGVGECAA